MHICHYVSRRHSPLSNYARIALPLSMDLYSMPGIHPSSGHSNAVPLHNLPRAPFLAHFHNRAFRNGSLVSTALPVYRALNLIGDLKDLASNKRMESKRSKRCGVCRASLAILAYSCKCEKQFCINHLPAQEHACTFNYQTDSREKLTKQLDVSGLSPKIIRI